jgi:wyosine [tRNA(Phe)-imidazoG37] synthetase (radical SAM superfamily)
MPQQDMEWSTFVVIINTVPPGKTVSLQGEGEPTLWQHWSKGIQYVADRNLIPYSIINGSVVDVELLSKYFPRIGISIDTLDSTEANKIGRYNIDKVLSNIELLSAAMPNRVNIHVTKIDKDTSAVVNWAKERKLQCIVQSLQIKKDYQVIYPANFKTPIKQMPGSDKTITCNYLSGNKYHYYTVSGKKLPCCYIKENVTAFNAITAAAQMKAGVVPEHCNGCRNLHTVQ